MKSKPPGTVTSRDKAVEQSLEPIGADVQVTDQFLTVTLQDGRVISTPLEWYPRLQTATPEQRMAWKWWGARHAIHWPALDEHLGIEGMLKGNPSAEYTRQLAHA
jgi:hypothetical protein